MTAEAISLAEFQHRYDDDQPATLTWGQVRSLRQAQKAMAAVLDVAPPWPSEAAASDAAVEWAKKLTRLGYAVNKYLHGQSTADELAAALDASGAME